MISKDWIDAAKDRISDKIIKTPCTYDSDLNAYLKWENYQKTGAFKLRGALNKVLALEPWEQERGLVAASAGNHGLGVAYAAGLVGTKATIFIPETSVFNKEEAIIKSGATVVKVKGGFSEAEKQAQLSAIKKGATWVSPYNDAQVIAGQATLGLEIIDQVQPFDARACLVPVSGGGLIAGIGLAFQYYDIPISLIGVQSENSAYFYSLYHKGTQRNIVETPSIADGLSGGVEKKSITIPLVRNLLDNFILVSDEEIEHAIAYAYFKHNEIIEGSAAVPIAAKIYNKIKDQKTILVISGGNIASENHTKICKKWENIWRLDR